jgi:opacity protein-like surface antigen
MFLALPDSARSDQAKSIAEGAAAGALVGIVCSSAALTADDEVDPTDFARRGWLIGAGGSYAVETFEDDAEADFENEINSGVKGAPSVDLSVDDSFGFNGRVGYRCHRYFSAEVEVEWIDGFEADLTQPGFVQLSKVRYEPLVVTANIKGYFLTGRYQPFLLVGGGVMTAERKMRDTVGLTPDEADRESDDAFAMRFGGGIDLYATENVVVSLEADYVLPFGNLDALDYISIGWGLQYRF